MHLTYSFPLKGDNAYRLTKEADGSETNINWLLNFPVAVEVRGCSLARSLITSGDWRWIFKRRDDGDPESGPDEGQRIHARTG